MARSLKLFDPSKLEKMVKEYCSTNRYVDFLIEPHELEQLRYFMETEIQSPESQLAGQAVTLTFEAQRAVTRAYCLELLKRGDCNSYQQFVMVQPDDKKLREAAFKQCNEQIRALLSRSHAECDYNKVLRASCFTVASKITNNIFKSELEITLPHDSEQNITAMIAQLIELDQQNQQPEAKDLSADAAASQHSAGRPAHYLPATNQLTTAEMAALHQCFWPLTHMRWMMFAEGGHNLTAKIGPGFDLELWKARWLLNLCGMSAGPAAKYLSAPIFDAYHDIAHTLASAIQKSRLAGFLPDYLQRLASHACFKSLPPKQRLLAGYLTANSIHLEPQRPAEFAELIHKALLWFTQSEHADYLEKFATIFQAFLENPNAKTPTYVPGLLKNAYANLQKLGLAAHEVDPFSAALIFTLQVRAAIAHNSNADVTPSAGSLANAKDLGEQLVLWLGAGMSPHVFQLVDSDYGRQISLDRAACEARIAATQAKSSLTA